MKVLFSPSKEKNFPWERGELSASLVEVYEAYVKFVLHSADEEVLRVLGYKKMDLALEVLGALSGDLKVLEAMRLYSGVAYKALDFESVENQDFLLENVLIFSNLFGVVRGGEKLPFYKLKQGEGFGEFESKKLYEKLKVGIDVVLEGESVVDLRAEFYKKLYTPQGHIISFDFLENGKRISHYAKYYRGIVLREIAKTQSLEGLEERLEQYQLRKLEARIKKDETVLVFTKT